MEVFTQLLWAVLPSVIVGIVMALFNRRQKKHTDAAEKKELAKVEYENLQLNLLVATAQLSYATAMAIKRGTPNGEMEVAIKQYEKAMGKFRAFERAQIAKVGADNE